MSGGMWNYDQHRIWGAADNILDTLIRYKSEDYVISGITKKEMQEITTRMRALSVDLKLNAARMQKLDLLLSGDTSFTTFNEDWK